MKIAESVLREKISRILSEEKFELVNTSGTVVTIDDAELVSSADHKHFYITSPLVSNFLDKLTLQISDAGFSSYITWKIVYEQLFWRNLKGRDVSQGSGKFTDVYLDGVNYSIKSTSRGSPTTAISGSPSFTRVFINSVRDKTEKYGIVAGYRISNDLFWKSVDHPKTGKELGETLNRLSSDAIDLQLPEHERQYAVNILDALDKGYNSNAVINAFFNPEKVKNKSSLSLTTMLQVTITPFVGGDDFDEKGQIFHKITQMLPFLEKEQIERIFNLTDEYFQSVKPSLKRRDTSGIQSDLFSK